MFDDLIERLQTSVPDLLLAMVILVVGYLLELLVQGLVRTVLRQSRVDDRIAAWVQGDDTVQPADMPRIERSVSQIVFWLLMLIVLVAFFNVLNLTGVAEPFNVFLTQIAAFAPRLISVAALILIAWVVATVLRLLVRAGLNAIHLDERVRAEVAAQPPSTTGAPPPTVSLTSTIANTVYWLVFLIFFPAILGALELQGLLEPVQSL